ncbi:hypothetical protein [Saccharicrinis fermentans]|uniref:SGNH hydrolase-type esterase domain-containing protein n=1 Tax=Saccharicrinis fermentans DSM 9555 = JCM 21142 TaxID=869213 RepID=W7YFQ0_9BACT|nr:hypothetical protein [Saccharicrinis fermentans]GAF03276.1 hypothetical protein JCM21142_41943 [Saccharicrinis fermentans DSM 9555 = JCM 21142]
MIKFLKLFVKFVPFAIVVYCILIFVTGRYLPAIATPNILNKAIVGHTFSRLKEAKETDNVDVLFLGSSHTYRGFDPRIFAEEGWRSFNLGSSAQTPLQTEILLDRYLERLNPKMIVYEVYPTTFSIDGVESFVDILYNDRVDMKSLWKVLGLWNIRLYNTLLYQFLRDPFNARSEYIEPMYIDGDTYVTGGYVEKDISYFEKENFRTQSWDFNDSQFQAFENTLSIIRKKDIPLVLVFAPITSALYDSYSNNDAFDDVMHGYGDYLNFNEIIELNDTLHFFDSNHLNQKGVVVFNHEFIRILRDKGF